MKKKDFGYFPDVKKKVEKQKSLFRQRTKEKIYDDFSTSIQLLEKTATSKFPSEPIRKQLGQGHSLIRAVGRLYCKIVNRFILSPLVTSCICFECSSLSVWPWRIFWWPGQSLSSLGFSVNLLRRRAGTGKQLEFKQNYPVFSQFSYNNKIFQNFLILQKLHGGGSAFSTAIKEE